MCCRRDWAGTGPSRPARAAGITSRIRCQNSGLRFPNIERAAAKVFPPECGWSVTIKNNMCKAELSVVTGDGSRHRTLFEYSGVAIAAPIDLERWWEDTIRSAWEEIKPATDGIAR